ncbi:leukemia NUP98 fusion partner 1 isoform X1 [Bos javanicus]|uniref:leukemia NUP98 fusion partner 1 isoform X1 n=1 Tax=Bos javanicus TaxID=9906 RepID=UPI002AA86F71|nr:leukemia NUP98 fusion partner 1 isoform X1 [Bos javanicus]XP_061237513.1 leukemia NUP98 fusion partner 1 isoform X1 [Bos javanicus]XP_061237593.1 leukemia NUP98 fusion partner 1 isoform X1 [Bos javanicus]XP_061237671.1 leukemia NUP98 fusion partner 1 isoform X1 [Bos javanicus]XP_061237679.1 leukemia NUP98 fusion partner 1 isoform X1 [Bos javanicus]XP_061237763.1 leukemia NUP98 fusion partner 1 isoform X1 [Bos javanicus]XP_061237809.1 leukemia NUP98 fusion partner 1 isoform X1 [Bos javanicu
MEHKDDDDDDDVSFAKWMSSFWGHSWIEEDERGLRDRRGSQDASYRKSSLPCPKGPTDQEDEISVQHEIRLFPVLPRMMSSASHPRRYSYEDQGFRCHTQVRDHRKCSGDGSFKEPLESKGRSHSKIQSFSDSFEQQLCFRTKRSVSLGPESRKERNERERRFLEVRSCKKVEEKRSSRKEEHGEAYLPTLSEKALK